MPVVVLAPCDDLFSKSISDTQEVMARGGKIVMKSDAKGFEDCGKGLWGGIEMPLVGGPFAAIAYAVPIEQLAYIRSLVSQGVSKAQVARDLGVSRMTVYRALEVDHNGNDA